MIGGRWKTGREEGDLLGGEEIEQEGGEEVGEGGRWGEQERVEVVEPLSLSLVTRPLLLPPPQPTAFCQFLNHQTPLFSFTLLLLQFSTADLMFISNPKRFLYSYFIVKGAGIVRKLSAGCLVNRRETKTPIR